MSMQTRPLKPGLVLLRSRPFRIAALFAIVALFVSACGGGSKNASNGSSAVTTGPSGAVAASPGPGSSGSSISSAPSGANAGPSGNSGPLANGSTGGAGLPITDDVTSLKSYRWDMTLEGKGAIVAQLGPDATGSTGAVAPSDSVNYDIKGAVIQPDKAQMELDTGGVNLKQTVIGAQGWTTVGGVTQGPTEVGADAASDLELPGFFDVGDVFRDVQGFDCSGSQNVNGVDTTVCSADMSDYQQMAAGVAGLLDNTGVETVNDFSLKIYVAKNGGYVVKTDMTMNGKGTDNKDFSLGIHLNVTDINNVGDITP
ncbi:MAG TPA: hypothetical protein VFY10_01205 [Dehalococcoidia bacterium]|nr:hypothetical protein [Dehalococcoidia bacterium]